MSCFQILIADHAKIENIIHVNGENCPIPFKIGASILDSPSNHKLANLIAQFIEKKLQFQLLKNIQQDNAFYDVKLSNKDGQITCEILVHPLESTDYSNQISIQQKMLDSLPNINWCCDLNFKLLAANQQFFELRLRNYQSSISIGESIFKEVQPQVQQKWEKIYHWVLTTQSQKSWTETIWLHAEVHHLIFFVNLIRDNQGKPIGFSGFSHEIQQENV